MQPNTQNWTQVTEFVMIGFAGVHEARLLFFAVFFTMYLFTLVENLAIILLVGWDHRLWKPMYFFLTHLSCLEIWYTSVTVPKMLAGFIGAYGGKNISCAGCLSQLFIFTFLGATESACWLVGVPTPIFPIYLMSQLTFCGPNIIDHFFCNTSPLLALSCSDVTLKETVDFLVSLTVLLASSTIITVSYSNIVWTLLHICSTVEQRKAFSTCAAYLTVVSLFYSTLFFMYVWTKVASSINFNKVVSVFYSIVTSMLNPLIYSLRNKEVKGALGRAFCLRSWKRQ
uniref:Olfactory receptor 6Q1 n=1 Tax=Nannospalax galili TaxID=1026970 RepID=A0A8C6WDG0_NANGA